MSHDPRWSEAAGGGGAAVPALAELAGEWELVSAVRDGQPLGAEFVASGRRVLRGDVTTVTFRGQVFMRGTTTVDATASPKAWPTSPGAWASEPNVMGTFLCAASSRMARLG